MWGYEASHYLGVLFLEKGGIIGIIFRISAEIWLPFEESCRIMVTILEKHGEKSFIGKKLYETEAHKVII